MLYFYIRWKQEKHVGVFSASHGQLHLCINKSKALSYDKTYGPIDNRFRKYGFRLELIEKVEENNNKLR